MSNVPRVIILSSFVRATKKLLAKKEVENISRQLQARPDTGDIIKDTGGVRKIRYASAGRGKSGGLRVIYYWFSTEDEIYLLTAYAKNQKGNLSRSEINTGHIYQPDFRLSLT